MLRDAQQDLPDLGAQAVVGDESVGPHLLVGDGYAHAGRLDDLGTDVAQHGGQGGMRVGSTPFGGDVDPGGRLR